MRLALLLLALFAVSAVAAESSPLAAGALCGQCPKCHFDCMSAQIGCHDECQKLPTPGDCGVKCHAAEQACFAQPTAECNATSVAGAVIAPARAQELILKAKSADPKRCSDCPQCDYMCMSTMIGCYSNCRSSPTPATCMNDCFAVQQTCGAQPTTFCTPPPVAVRPQQTILKAKSDPKRCSDCPQCHYQCMAQMIGCYSNCRSSPTPATCMTDCFTAQQTCGAQPTDEQC